jgi:alpha-1,6-mannosyltransferase
MVALLLTVPLDSLLWQRPVWPEGEVFYFNTILGKSKEWGTSPWHWYFTSAVPKAMLLTLLLVPLAMCRVAEILFAYDRTRDLPLTTKGLVDTRWFRFLLPIIGFVVLYSFLGHKEMRFIFPALPVLNLGAAVGMSKLTSLAFPDQNKKDDDASTKQSSSLWMARLGFGCGLLCMILTLFGSLAFVAVSRWNYPGGVALTELTLYIRNLTNPPPASVHVHVDVAAAMSGVSLFGQRQAQFVTPQIDWKFSKDGYEEGRSFGSNGFDQFTHSLTEDPSNINSETGFHIIRTIQGKPRLSLAARGIVTEAAIFVMERNGWRDELSR